MDYYPSEDILKEAKKRRCYTVLDMLGERIYFMVYPKSDYAKNGPYIIPVMFSEIGRDVAKILCKIIPECQYPHVGHEIQIFDYDNCEDVFCESNIVVINNEFVVGITESNYKTISLLIAEFR